MTHKAVPYIEKHKVDQLVLLQVNIISTMSESKDLRTVRFSCACRQVSGSFKAQQRDLPLSLTLCHCTTCRQQSGLLCITGASLPQGTEFDVKGPLTAYKASADLSRFFCSNCGANVYLEETNTKKEVCAGLLEEVEGVVRLDQHIFVKDTKDGGLSDWIPDVKAWEGFSDVSKKVDSGWKDDAQVSSKGEQELHAHCRCKGVGFKISRPDASSANLKAPRGDIAGSKTSETDHAWWLAENGTKYLGGTCACTSCRLTSGYDIATWAFVPQSNITQPDGTPLDFSAGTLKRYESSQGVHREFCSKCGATVFYHADRRPGLIDVSAGLLDAEEGARAESWLGWETKKVSHEEDALNKDLINRLSAGLRQWGENKGSSSSGGK